MEDAFTLSLDAGESVSALWSAPGTPRACLILAHGAGAGMTHRSMSAIAEGLQARGLATLRYQFPFMERGAKRVDPPSLAEATVRAAAAEAFRRIGTATPLFAGGRSFGGRMTSRAQASAPLPGVRGLVFFAFPLHPAGKPSVDRARHLARIAVPMLFLQGSRDALADLGLLRETLGQLHGLASLELAEDADHAFHVPARTGRKDPEVLAGLLDLAAAWMTSEPRPHR